MSRLPLLAVAALCLAAVIVAGARHNDDTDSALYTVVVRNMVRDGTWVDLTYLPTVHPHFREHLPFAFWPGAVVLKAFGERALPVLGSMWTLGTLFLVYELTRRLTDQPTGLLAVAMLACTEPFITAGVSNRIDVPMVFFSLLAALPPLSRRGEGQGEGKSAFALSTIALLCAVAIKGPFGGVVFFSAVLTRAAIDRDPRRLLFGALCGALAVLPIVLFLRSSDDWWHGYVETQLLASANGTRTDGSANPFFPIIAIASHCWPLLALVPFGLIRVPRVVLITAALSIVVLMIPGRRLWQHTLIVWPVLAVIAGAGARRLPKALVGAVAISGLIAIGVVPRGRARSCLEFRDQISAPISVMVSGDGAHWREVAVLAAELRVEPVLVSSFPEAGKVVVSDGVEVPQGFRIVRNARGWTIAERDFPSP